VFILLQTRGLLPRHDIGVLQSSSLLLGSSCTAGFLGLLFGFP
jgi:hypothetical protein